MASSLAAWRAALRSRAAGRALLGGGHRAFSTGAASATPRAATLASALRDGPSLEEFAAGGVPMPAARRARPVRERKPEWLRVERPSGEDYTRIKKQMRSLKLATVCEEARCPNIGECWGGKKGTATATIMVRARAPPEPHAPRRGADAPSSSHLPRAGDGRHVYARLPLLQREDLARAASARRKRADGHGAGDRLVGDRLRGDHLRRQGRPARPRLRTPRRGAARARACRANPRPRCAHALSLPALSLPLCR